MRPTKTSHTFQVKGKQVKFTSNFDGGNLRTVTQMTANEFLVESSLDSYEMEVSQKSFFHFSVQNYPQNQLIVLNLPGLALLGCIRKDYLHRYRPCFSTNGEQYERLGGESVVVIQKEEKITLQIKFIITKPRTYFSFSLPYSYQRYLNMVRDLPSSHPDFYIKKQVLCYSKNLNLIYMITITSFDRQTSQQDMIGSLNNGVILPEKHIDSKRTYFNKPVILLSGRVHPGQSPSSWAIEGIIKFLTGNSPQAVLLRKYFQIVIVPMLNPDGVYEGMYRFDTIGHNLNRYYLISDNRQPSIYSMKHLIKHYDMTKRLLYFFDFHGHPSFKGSFMYGNAIDQIAYQTETELFGRIMSFKCNTFQEKYCIFDREQMSSKDRHDMYTKEGCARVYAFKTANILHAYTIEMGFHACTSSNSNMNENFIYDKDSYYAEGVAVLESVLESCGIVNNYNKQQLRLQIASQITTREERFKRQDKNLGIKKRNVNQIIENEYWKPVKMKFFEKLQPKNSFISRQQTPKKIKNETSTNLYEKRNERQNFSSEFSIRKKSKKDDFSFLKATKTDEEKKYEDLFMEKTKQNFYMKKIIFNSKNRKVMLFENNEEEKNMPKVEIKTIETQNKIERRKSFERRKGSKYILNRSQESMFCDNNLRGDESYKKNLEDTGTRTKFSIISDKKINNNYQEIKEMFKLDSIAKHPNLGGRRLMKLEKFSSLNL